MTKGVIGLVLLIGGIASAYLVTLNDVCFVIVVMATTYGVILLAKAKHEEANDFSGGK